MLRTDIVLLGPTSDQENELLHLASETSLLWNQANYERRQAFFKCLKMPTYNQQAYRFRTNEHYKAVGAGNAQTLLQKLDESWRSFWQLKKMQKQGQLPQHIAKISPPRYWKDRKTGKTEVKVWYIRNDYYRVKDGIICISGNRHGRKLMNLKYRGILRKGKYGRLEVLYDKLSNRWYAHIPVEIKKEKKVNPTIRKKYGSIDLGICNIAAVYVPKERPLVYSGRAVLSDWIYHTKKIAKLQSQLKQGQYTSTRIERLFKIRNRRFRHTINSMLRNLFERLQANQITHIVVGDLNGIRYGNNLGRQLNQKLHNFWNHNYILKRIKELGEEYSIEIIEQSERGTSKTCCMCGQQHNGRIHRGLHVCYDRHEAINADVSGAYNLYNVAVYCSLCSEHTVQESSGSRHLAMPLMLRWEYHQWH